MARWLSLDDLIAIQHLQTQGTQLDLERALLWPHTPLRAALLVHVPMSAVGAETIVLYPSATRRVRAVGFLQSRRRLGRPEADVVYLAPALDAHEDAVSIWYRLLAECAKEVGARGGQRLFVRIQSGNGVEEVFRQGGFAAYAREAIYRLGDWPPDLKKTNLLRRQRARDGWNLLRLYAQLTPRPVQIAEGMLSSEGQEGKTVAPLQAVRRLHSQASVGDWWDQSRGAGYILEVDGELTGAVRVRRGSAAYWLRFGLHPQAQGQADAFLRGALSLLWAAPRHPIYCSVREYESGMSTALEQAGFAHLCTRNLLVKHITARAKEPTLKLVPALEKRPEPAASVSHHTSSHK